MYEIFKEKGFFCNALNIKKNNPYRKVTGYVPKDFANPLNRYGSHGSYEG